MVSPFCHLALILLVPFSFVLVSAFLGSCVQFIELQEIVGVCAFHARCNVFSLPLCSIHTLKFHTVHCKNEKLCCPLLKQH